MNVMVTGGARSGKSSFAERWVMKHVEAAVYVATGQAFDDEMKARIALHRQEREHSGFAWTTLEEPLRLGELLSELGVRLGVAGGDTAGKRTFEAPGNPALFAGRETQALSSGSAAAFGRFADTAPASTDFSASSVSSVSSAPSDSFALSAARPVVLVDCLTLWLSNVLLAAEDQPEAADVVVGREIERLAAAARAFPGTLVMVTNEVGSGIVPEYPLGRLYRDLAGMLNRTMARISDQVFLVTAGIPIELKSREYRL